MVGRMDNDVSTSSATLSSKAPKTVPIQAMQIKLEQKSSGEETLPKEKAIKMVGDMNTFLASADSQLKFKYHEELNEYYVTIIDMTTDEVIREIPSKKLMDIHAAMREFVGLLVDRKI